MKSKGNIILYRLYGKKRNSQKGKVIQKWKNKKHQVGKFINYAVFIFDREGTSFS